ncbi:MAG: ABC transporter permease [Microgenomates group bacterium]
MNKNLKLYFQLLEVFTIREIKSRYRASILGPLWIILQPLLTTIFLAFIFEKIIKIKVANIPYFLFLYSGLIIWGFFEQGINLAKDSLVWNRELIVKSKFSKNALPLSFVLSKIPDYFVNLIIFILLMLFFKQKVSFIFIFSSLTIFPLFLFSSGIGLIFSILNAIFRDFGRIIDFLLLIGFYATPVIYLPSMVSNKLLFFLKLNPLFYLISYNRSIFFENKLEFNYLILGLLTSLILFLIGIIFFKKLEKIVVDLI